MSYFLIIGIFYYLAVSALAAPGSTTFTKLNLHIEAHTDNQTIYHGYTAHRFTIRHSGTGKRSVSFKLPRSNYSEDHSLNSVSRTFTVLPGTREVTILQPPLTFGYSNDGVLIECNGQERHLEMGLSNKLGDHKNTGWQRARIVLLSRKIDKPALESALSRVSPGRHSSHGGHGSHAYPHVVFHTADRVTSKWGTNWLDYSAYDMLILYGEEWNQANEDTRSAIQRWVRTGGHLVVIGDKKTNPSTLSNGFNRKSFIGFGLVDHFQSESNESRNSILKLLKADTPQNNQKAIPMIGDLNEAVEIIHDEHHWHGANNRDFNSFFPVVDGVRTPVRLVIGLLTLFVLIAGPINLYLLNRKDVRAWFLWTLPVISLLTSALVFVVSIFSEGVTPRVRTESVTILNQKEQEAVTLGGIGVYAPIAPGRLDFSGNSEVTPLIDGWKRDTGSGRSVAWTDGGEQLFTGKWASSRVPTHFAIRKSEHTEKRIEIDWEKGTPKIINSLGAPLSQLTLRSARGDFFTATDILPGEKVTLRPNTAGIPQRSTINEFANTLLESSAEDEWEHLSIGLMPESTYWAVIDRGSPFLENPLAYRKTKDTTLSHVVGVLPPEEMTP